MYMFSSVVLVQQDRGRTYTKKLRFLGKKRRSRTQKSHPKVVNPRDIAGERKKKKKKKACSK